MTKAEQTANYEPPIPEQYFDDGNGIAYTAGHKRGFVVGANWQKEQYKDIKEALELGYSYMKLYMLARGHNTAPVIEPGSAMDKVLKAIELLQD